MLIDFLLRQKCGIRPWLGIADGTDQFGPEEERACRLQEGRYLQQDSKADTAVAKALMFCTGADIPERSRVTCGGREYIVLACRRAQGWGQAHLEVTLA